MILTLNSLRAHIHFPDRNHSHFQLASEQSYFFFKDVPEKHWRLKREIHCAASARDLQEGRDISNTGKEDF